jgi:16S rRNA (guanine527-N7)-methyltransferase
MVPPEGLPDTLAIVRLPTPLFQELDAYGTRSPLLVLRIPELPKWAPEEGLPPGLSLFLPFQDPENLGAAIRCGLAFGVARIILLGGAAHPFHPKTLRASGGAVLRAPLALGPALASLPEGLPLVALSAEGEELSRFTFPPTCALLPGIEGPGLPAVWRRRSVRIPIRPEVESLNAAAAVAIVLFEWARRNGQISRGTGRREG